MYEEIAAKKFKELQNKDDYLILAIESSCDETSAAVTRGRDVLSLVIASQIEIHKRFGGVVPEIASRNHVSAIRNTVDEALKQANVSPSDISAVAVTYGAGLLGALLVGVSYAKALAYAMNVPLIKVNHVRGHISANYIADKSLEPPYLCLLASGGHTAIVEVVGYDDVKVIGTTQDDAVGEAFDKVARVLGLPYPGGPEIEKLAKDGKPTIDFPKGFHNKNTLDFSYSGLKTSVINYMHTAAQKGEEVNKADVACSFQKSAVGVMTENVEKALLQTGLKTVVIAGGVASNKHLREEMEKVGEKHGVNVVYPPLKLCTDNAAMIGACAFNLIKEGKGRASLDLDASASVSLE
ncbi:MAG: tRNA (adenosine(37)-N6)-threonylcarbamoyltransferase complex transferase subunit TsaD [Christensenellales bacterium]|nr:tRNA (adenosine(37)-N6)-threonylcarbamoyltransferase complex transferase subunit TsaD [Christensenellales bacterium]